jgi:uncharacterized protein YerC
MSASTGMGISSDMLPQITKILPSLKEHSIVKKDCLEKNVTESDVQNLCRKIGVRTTGVHTDEPLPLSRLLLSLSTFSEFDQTYTKKLNFLDRSDRSHTLPLVLKSKPLKSIFGLPSEPSADGLVYQCRKQLGITHTQVQEEKKKRADMRSNSQTNSLELFRAERSRQEATYPAQRKVANALLMMVGNETMLYHFIHKGGIDALFKLIRDSKDRSVLVSCTNAILIASKQSKYCNLLVDSGLIPAISTLAEMGDDDILYSCAATITNLTYFSGSSDADENIVLFGVLPVLTIIVTYATRVDTLCYTILCINNLAQVFDGADSVIAVRMLLNLATRLEVMTNIENAIFLTDIIKNISRITRYLNPLCEESALPLLLNVLDEYFHPQIVLNMAECFANLSISKKNRRDIAVSGVALHLEKIFSQGTPDARAFILRMVGNLLFSGLFHERIARDEILTTILNKMMDPHHSAQFTAVCYVFSQLAIQDSSVQALVRCDAVRIALSALRLPGVNSKDQSTEGNNMIVVSKGKALSGIGTVLYCCLNGEHNLLLISNPFILCELYTYIYI